ncbi:MAG: hypothetical protein ACRC5H_05375, partial [Treponemataceae bacterium]
STRSTDEKNVLVPLSNWKDVEGYIREKGFGQVESFATFAMSQYMSRFPLTEGQKARIEKSIE